MEKKSLFDLEESDYKKITQKIIEEKDNENGLIRLINKATRKNYLEQKNIVQHNIISKEKNRSVITCENFSLGYIVSSNELYDFISGKVYPIYKLYENKNTKKEGKYALITCIMFEDSKEKIKLDKNNLMGIENIFRQYVNDHRLQEIEVKKFNEEEKNEEYIPSLTKTLRK